MTLINLYNFLLFEKNVYFLQKNPISQKPPRREIKIYKRCSAYLGCQIICVRMRACVMLCCCCCCVCVCVCERERERVCVCVSLSILRHCCIFQYLNIFSYLFSQVQFNKQNFELEILKNNNFEDPTTITTTFLLQDVFLGQKKKP